MAFADGGRFARIRIPGAAPAVHGDRKAITAFSARARKNLLDRLNQIDQRKVSALTMRFVTLTYPESFPTARASKRHLDTLLKRFEREYGERALFWKLEPQLRGAPHYHLLILHGVEAAGPALEAEVSWWAHAWADVVDPSPEDRAKMLAVHLGHVLGGRPCVEVPRSWDGVASYAGKYLGKLPPEGHEFKHPGRWWGIRRANLLPVSLVTVPLTVEQAIKLRREMRRLIEHQRVNRFYIPGAVRVSGAHSPGQTIWGDQMYKLPGDRPKPFKYCVPELQKLLGPHRPIRHLRRRLRRGPGGISGYIASDTAARLVAWVQRECPTPAAPIALVPF